MEKNLIIIIIITLIVLISFFIFKPFSKNNLQTTTLKLNNHNYQIEIASTMSQKAIGLSGRNQLCPNCGMIFLFSYQGILPFWMKDTFIPLDMIWLDSNDKIVNIQTVIETNSSKILKNSTPAQYVLELNANDSQKIGLKIGDIIDLSNLSDQKK